MNILCLESDVIMHFFGALVGSTFEGENVVHSVVGL